MFDVDVEVEATDDALDGVGDPARAPSPFISSSLSLLNLRSPLCAEGLLNNPAKGPNPPKGSSSGLVESSGSSPCNDLIAFLMREPRCANDNCKCKGSITGTTEDDPDAPGPTTPTEEDEPEPAPPGECPPCN